MKFLNRQQCYELLKEVWTKQRGDKSIAISRILEDYKQMMDKAEEQYFKIIQNVKCKKCGGIILTKVHIFSQITCGGNPVVGCPVCKTFSSGRMLFNRDDIELTRHQEEACTYGVEYCKFTGTHGTHETIIEECKKHHDECVKLYPCAFFVVYCAEVS